MKSQEISKELSKLPDAPGVYLFLGEKKPGKGYGKSGREVLYVGKATSLRDRVRSYFRGDIAESRGPLIVKMLSEFRKIEHIKTDSVLEALILEAELIKKIQPPANVAQKDDKSFNYVVITDEKFPRVLTARERELTVLQSVKIGAENIRVKRFFGPFPHGSQLREAMKIVRKIFPYRDEKCFPAGSGKNKKGKPCFNRQIGLCPGVCSGEISAHEYSKQIANIVTFFEGKKKQLTKNLEKEMKAAAKAKKFETAGELKRQIFALNHIRDVSLIKDVRGNHVPSGFRLEAYDVAHMSGKMVVGAMTVIVNGEVAPGEYRKFNIKTAENNDVKALKEMLDRRLLHIEWPMPNLIVIDGGLAQRNAAKEILNRNNISIPVVSVVKDDRHKAMKIEGDKGFHAQESSIILANSEAHRFAINFHKSKRNISRFGRRSAK